MKILRIKRAEKMKISMKTSKTMKEYFDDFIIAKKAHGLADTYNKSCTHRA